jgi:ribosome-associated protein
MHLSEQWREKLLHEAGAVEAFARDFPSAPSEKILELVGKARDERAARKPPKYFRELYQVIHGIVQGKSAE